MKVVELRTCLACGGSFLPRDPRQQYCDRACKVYGIGARQWQRRVRAAANAEERELRIAATVCALAEGGGLMPISRDNAARYPSNWRAISDRIKQRAGNKCEGIPGQPFCGAGQSERHPITGAIVILTVAHLNHQPEDCRDENLRALCQRCHNRYDQPHRRQNAAKTNRAKKRNGELFP